jgi:hypothetical protein
MVAVAFCACTKSKTCCELYLELPRVVSLALAVPVDDEIADANFKFCRACEFKPDVFF